MKRVLIALAVLAIAATAFAGQNPQIRAFITMDPNDYVYSNVNAVPNSINNTYLCFDCFGEGGGITAFSMILDYQCGGFVAGAADITLFGPSAQTVIGGPDNITVGWVVAVPTDECHYPNVDGVVCVAMIPWFYTGPAGDIVILPNPVDGQATVDCLGALDFFCVLSNGALGQVVVTPGDENCDCNPNAVDNTSWGGIKALYR
jgi:hypothetical protein